MTDLRTLLGDKEFMKDITEMENAEDVQKAFKEKGVDLTLEQIEEIGYIINATIEKGSALSEDELEEISGGETGDDFFEGLKSPIGVILDKTCDNSAKKAGAGIVIGGLGAVGFIAGAVSTITAVTGIKGVKKIVKWAKKKIKH